MSYHYYIGVRAVGSGSVGFGWFADKLILPRYGGHTYAGQSIWQKNLAQGAMVLASFSDWADVDFLAAGFGRGNPSDYGFG